MDSNGKKHHPLNSINQTVEGREVIHKHVEHGSTNRIHVLQHGCGTEHKLKYYLWRKQKLLRLLE